MQAASDVSPGKLVRSAREDAGLTREEFARRAQVSTSTVGRLELNDHLPKAPALARIANLAGLLVSDLLPPDERIAS